MDAFLLCAGHGLRLKPLTDVWPKCLMPINGIPLLEYWIASINNSEINNIYLNVHAHEKIMNEFVNRKIFSKTNLIPVIEKELLGTAGAIRNIIEKYNPSGPLMVIHADNYCGANLGSFIKAHEQPPSREITMMTFITKNPSECGILQTDKQGYVVSINEKDPFEDGTLANGAVYIFSQKVLKYIVSEGISDISNELLCNFKGKIHAYHNESFHVDIGNLERLRFAQSFQATLPVKNKKDEWTYKFLESEIYQKINERLRCEK